VIAVRALPIITTNANAIMAELHNGMPLILNGATG
jgi:putative SOS response-associated peptidase YedK